MNQSLCTITSNIEVMPGVNLMWLEAPDVAAIVQPGQFITVCSGDLVLRRPFSVHQVDSNRVALLFAIKGKGTFWLSQRRVGDKIDILGPLGGGFNIESSSRNLLLVAGGIGIAPLAFLAGRASLEHSIILIHGASTASQLYPCSSLLLTTESSLLKAKGKIEAARQGSPAPLPDSVQFVPVTEDGSVGRKGVVTDVLPDFLDWADQVYACGPINMYQVMSNMLLPAERNKLKMRKCQVSLEVRMGCGIGACYGCTITTTKGLKQVCRDGPVFELDDILWEEVSI
jgi:dihydroorotate dehydrogenase electron transfer subunit